MGRGGGRGAERWGAAGRYLLAVVQGWEDQSLDPLLHRPLSASLLLRELNCIQTPGSD